MRILKIISGLVLIATALWCFANQGVIFSALAFVLGIVMIFTSVTGILTFWSMKKRPEGLGWMLSEAITTGILGLVVLSDQLATELTISMFFGMWLLFSGSNRAVGAMTMKRQDSKAWHWTFMFSALSFAIGVYALLNQMFWGIPLGLLLTLFFLIYGVNILSMGVVLPHVKKERGKRNRDRQLTTEGMENTDCEQCE